MKRIIFVFVTTMFLASVFTGCATTTVTIEEENQSLGEIKRALIAIMGDPRKTSENQREFTSQYFGRKEDPKFDPNKVKERLYATFTILGDRRPYDIDITVYVEEKVGRSYQNVGTDPTVARSLAKELQARLNQSRDGRNIIDDFKVF